MIVQHCLLPILPGHEKEFVKVVFGQRDTWNPLLQPSLLELLNDKTNDFTSGRGVCDK